MIADIPHASTTEDIFSSLEAMRRQEETGYKYGDYLAQNPVSSPMSGPQCPVDAECRVKMAEWCYQVVDFCHFNRETVAIAMSYLDRYLMTATGKAALENRKLFQLAAMTCLYTAIKIHEPEAMEPKVVAGLSRGTYTEEQVTSMETVILGAINWRMNPPTALAFVHHYMALLPDDAITSTERIALMELAKCQTELAVEDYSFVGVAASTVAMAAFTNALSTSTLSFKDTERFLDALAKLTKIERHSTLMFAAQDILCQSVQSSSPVLAKGIASPKRAVSKIMENGDQGRSSPRCVVGSQ